MEQTGRIGNLSNFDTERLHLRALRPDDEEFLASLDSHPEVRRFIHTGLPMTARQARIEAEAQVYVAAHRLNTGRWMIELRETGVRIGWIQLVKYCGPRIDDTLNDYLQIDYELSPKNWGHGYMSEAARAVIGYAFGVLELSKVVAFTRPENRRSVRLIEKLGFEQVGSCQDEAGNTCNLYLLIARPGRMPTTISKS